MIQSESCAFSGTVLTHSSQLPRFRLTLLGRIDLTTTNGAAPLPRGKLAGLVAYLAYTAPQPQPRERLANLLWGSSFETQARQNLRHALFQLRRILGENAIVSDDNEVWLAPGAFDCDVARFKMLIGEANPASFAAAIDLYRHPFLTDLNIAEDAWSDWRDLERKRLEDMALNAMVGYGHLALQAGDAESALKSARQAIGVNVLREDAHRLMMQALAAGGRKAEALKCHKDLVALLARELNTEPDPLTEALVAELRDAPPPGTSRSVSGFHHDTRGPSEQNNGGRPAEIPGNDIPASVTADVLEQRQLTIMVCSLITLAPASADHDVEDDVDLVTGFHRTVADLAARFGGIVAQYRGKAVALHFGYPTAHEYDAERAVSAGLALVSSIERLASSDVKIQASVGIATGLVVVGEKPATDNRWHQVVIGEAPDLATRLQAAATAGEVVIDAGTHRLVGRMFDCRPLLAPDGISVPTAWKVRGKTIGMSRFDALRGDAIYPLVGREMEIELLLRRWHQASAGQGAVVAIAGEAGIGKSRIVESMLARIDGKPQARFIYSCSPYHAHSALYPFIARIEHDAGFKPGDSADTRLDKLKALLKPTASDLPRDVALLAELVGIRTEPRHPSLTVSPQQKREMLFGALLGQIDGAASEGPILIVVEDAHWMDPTSADLLERLVHRAASLPILVIVTLRPGFQPSWMGQPHVTALPLNRLDASDSAAIINGITRGKVLPDVVVEQILSRADGVPLFVEELTRALLAGGLLRETADRYVVDGPLQLPAIPAMLRASLAARLDLLGSAKGVAMIGATIGREFSRGLIAAVSDLAPTDLDAALARLTASGLISRRGTAPHEIYMFKHALVRDAAYATMLKSRRRQLHASIGRALVDHFPALTESQPEIVAHHFAEAKLDGKAIGYWVKAGRLAHTRWANREAAVFFEQALNALDTLPETRETLQQAIDLRFDLKASLFPLGQFERAISCLQEAEVLANRLDDRRRLCHALVHMCQTLGLSGNPKDAVVSGEKAQALALSIADIPLQVISALFLGFACFSTQDYEQAEHQLLKVLQLLGRERSLEQLSVAGFPAVTAHSYLARIYADQGKFKRGIAHGEESIRLAEAANHPYSLAVACWCLADLFAARGELSGAFALLERGLAVAREWNLPFLVAGSSGSLGYVTTLMGRTDEGVSLLEQALEVFENMGHRFGQLLFLVPLGEACVLAGRSAAALGFAERGLALARESGQRSGEASALHLLGEASACEGNMELAEGYYRSALALAAEVGMRPLVAHCHRDLGKLYGRIGKRDDARDQLTSAIAMYREMDMRFWLEKANAEMRSLAPLHH